jgi:alkylation response protein AidB-like acyl-CoA dehydrogenase
MYVGIVKSILFLMSDVSVQNNKPLEIFISDFKASIKSLFEEWNSCDKSLVQRGFSKEMLSGIMKNKPLSVAVPSEYEGRGMHVHECLSILEAASYESLPLSLIFGINIALFLEPFAKYGQDSAKTEVFRKFIHEQAMGGLMISEPLYGSDALNMQTSFTKQDGKYHVKGTKHWQGLTGMGDFWLVAAREKSESGSLGRDIGMFMTDNSIESQQIQVEELYNNPGLYPIPYGKNNLDFTVPEENRLVPESTGLKLLMDVLHRSRMQFPGMGMGFLRRILEEATDYCTNRLIRGNSLQQFDQVNHHLAQLQSAFTICSAMCLRSSSTSGYDVNVALCGVEANAIKALVTDLMQRSAQILTQLQGSSGYKIESFGSRGIMDSRPFQIFEGPNEMLFSQVAEAVLKDMNRKKVMNLFEFLNQYYLTKDAAAHFKTELDVSLDKGMLQREQVIIGEVISRVINANSVLHLSNKGFNKGMIDSCMDIMKQEVSSLMNYYSVQSGVMPVEDIYNKVNWNSFV